MLLAKLFSSLHGVLSMGDNVGVNPVPPFSVGVLLNERLQLDLVLELDQVDAGGILGKGIGLTSLETDGLGCNQ